MDQVEGPPHVTAGPLDFVRLEVHHEAFATIQCTDDFDGLWLDTCGLRIDGIFCPEQFELRKRAHDDAFGEGQPRKRKN